MGKKDKKDVGTSFNLHDDYGSVKELEREIQKVVDATNNLVMAMYDANLPHAITYGIAKTGIDTYASRVRAMHEEMAKAEVVGMLETLGILGEE